MQKIGTCAFGRCSNLAEVEFLGDRNAIDMKLPHVFENTPYLESLEFSLFIENGNYLSGFTGVCPETVNIPDGVSYIANTFDGGFPSVTNLVNLSLPASITYMDRGIFSGCIKLQSVTFGREDWLDYYDMMAFLCPSSSEATRSTRYRPASRTSRRMHSPDAAIWSVS